PMVPCDIIESRVVQENRGSSSGFVPFIRYRYTVGGKTYLSAQIHARRQPVMSDYQNAQQRAARYPAGQKRFCHVNPLNPREAILEASPQYAGLLLSPFLLVIWALYERVAIADWLEGLRTKKARSPQPLTTNRAFQRSRRKQLLVGCMALV